MKIIELDGNNLVEVYYPYLKSKLELPDYFSENLDALFDSLTEMVAEISIVNSNKMDKALLATFVDASSENSYLKLDFK